MKLNNKAAGWALVCVTLVAGFEGLYTHAYHDKLAYGIPTVCYGETEGVKMTDVYTPQQCADMLAAKLPRYNAEISRCIRVVISDKERAAYVSAAYNFGSSGFCHSTIVRRLNAGDSYGACDALLMWNRASGRVVRGLTIRREAERKLCREGVAERKTGKAVIAQNAETPAPVPPPKPVKRRVVHQPTPKPAPNWWDEFFGGLFGQRKAA